MKKAFILVASLLLIDARASAQGTTENKTNTSASGPSRTMLQLKMNDHMQDAQKANRDLATLKDFRARVAEALKKVDNAKVPEKPKVFEELVKTLDDLKNLKSDTPLGPTNPTVKKLIDEYTDLQEVTPIVPGDLTSLMRSRDPLLAPILGNIPRPYLPDLIVDNIDELITSLGSLEDGGKFAPVPTPPTREKVEAQIEAAITEAAGLAKQFEDTVNRFKSSAKSIGSQLDTALAAESTRQETLAAQGEKSAEEIAKQIDAQTANVANLIDRLPILVGILCGLFIGLILLIRIYPPELQAEWVASGQVIQLLTVVTLLLIILCLAVTHVIGENTVGTLLGGIGGYVLSQGIGRAAAREASRTKPPASI